MTREDVFRAIDSERDYQELAKQDSTRPDILEEFHAGDTLAAIQYNLNKALDAWYKEPAPYNNSLVYLRKIAGLTVQLGEKYGMPERELQTI